MRTVSLRRDVPMEASLAGAASCRDCIVPPGALGIVLHTTDRGPVVHNVREGSTLLQHVTPGDCIIAVDDKDTKSCRAEEVMTMLMARRGYCRKITVLSSAPLDGTLQSDL